VFVGARVAVMVDSCYWHGCPGHGTWPKANVDWWRTKIERNRARDADTDERLAEVGWLAVRVWERKGPIRRPTGSRHWSEGPPLAERWRAPCEVARSLDNPASTAQRGFARNPRRIGRHREYGVQPLPVQGLRGEEVMRMATRNTRQTGTKAASAAGKVLANPSSTKAEKAAAASALSQAPKQRRK
jgi:hypothetical protein